MSAEITVYGKPGCSKCTKTTTALENAKIDFTYHDISVDAQALKEALSYGYSQAPVVVLDGAYGELIAKSWSGYNETNIASLVALTTV